MLKNTSVISYVIEKKHKTIYDFKNRTAYMIFANIVYKRIVFLKHYDFTAKNYIFSILIKVYTFEFCEQHI